MHLYNSTSVLQREVVFRTGRQGIIDIALEGARLCRAAEASVPEVDIHYEYSPESYTGTELEFAVDICNQVIELGPIHASIHQIDEHIAVADIETLKNLYRRTLERLEAIQPAAQATA